MRQEEGNSKWAQDKKVKFDKSILIDFVIFGIITKEWYRVKHGGFVVICEAHTQEVGKKSE